MTKIPSLFVVTNTAVGGWYTYTAHLAMALGLDEVYRVGDHTEGKLRDFAPGVSYQNLSVGAAVAHIEDVGGVVTCAEPKKWAAALRMIEAGAALVVHDPKEMKPVRHEGLRRVRRVVAIREINLAALADIGVKATFVRHPYQPLSVEHHDRHLGAAATRVDAHKHPEVIVQANPELSEPITLHGFENRVWCHHTLDAKFPQWREYYRGSWARDDLYGAVRLLADRRYAVDLSVLKGDGGGTQYAHFEAWNAGCRLIVHRAWGDKSGASRSVETAAELVDTIHDDKPWDEEHQRAKQMLGHHAPHLVAPEFIDAVT